MIVMCRVCSVCALECWCICFLNCFVRDYRSLRLDLFNLLGSAFLWEGLGSGVSYELVL